MRKAVKNLAASRGAEGVGLGLGQRGRGLRRTGAWAAAGEPVEVLRGPGAVQFKADLPARPRFQEEHQQARHAEAPGRWTDGGHVAGGAMSLQTPGGGDWGLLLCRGATRPTCTCSAGGATASP